MFYWIIYFILIMIICLLLPAQTTGQQQQQQQHFMHAAPGSMAYSHGAGGATSQALAAATAALADSGILSHTHLHRNTNSSQRPPSTGGEGE